MLSAMFFFIIIHYVLCDQCGKCITSHIIFAMPNDYFPLALNKYDSLPNAFGLKYKSVNRFHFTAPKI